MSANEQIENEIDDLTSDLFREDELGAVIRAHIRVESILLRIVEMELADPKQLKTLKLDYDSLVTLALALGLEDHFAPPLRALGKLRNNFAHKPNTKLDKQMLTNLYNTLAADDKEVVQKTFAQIKVEHESTRHILRYTDLEIGDQFKLIYITIWGKLRGLELNKSEK